MTYCKTCQIDEDSTDHGVDCLSVWEALSIPSVTIIGETGKSQEGLGFCPPIQNETLREGLVKKC